MKATAKYLHSGSVILDYKVGQNFRVCGSNPNSAMILMKDIKQVFSGGSIYCASF